MSSKSGGRSNALPIVRRFPGLTRVPRVSLGRFFTPIVRLDSLSGNLWIKRDDLCGDPLGGNKVRALEFLLANLEKDETVVTVGSAGSTHALAVATYGARLGAKVLVGRWRQEMNDAATIVSERVARTARLAPVFRTPAEAYAWAWMHHARGGRWIAAGGSSPLGILGHVNAGLELIEQIDAGAMPQPSRVVVPLGTGGTAAGLALAFAIAERDIVVVGARVVPKIIGRKGRVLGLARRTARLIEQRNGTKLPRVRSQMLTVVDDTYGGAYGRETSAGKAAAEKLRASYRLGLDPTYAAKAFAYCLDARDPTLFWLTFDSRILGRP